MALYSGQHGHSSGMTHNLGVRTGVHGYMCDGLYQSPRVGAQPLQQYAQAQQYTQSSGPPAVGVVGGVGEGGNGLVGGGLAAVGIGGAVGGGGGGGGMGGGGELWWSASERATGGGGLTMQQQRAGAGRTRTHTPGVACTILDSMYNPADMALRHRNLFHHQPSKHFLANPQAVPRVEPILRMSSKLGILDGHINMSIFSESIFADEAIDYGQTPMGASATIGGAWPRDGQGQVQGVEVTGARALEDPGSDRPAKRVKPVADMPDGGGNQ